MTKYLADPSKSFGLFYQINNLVDLTKHFFNSRKYLAHSKKFLFTLLNYSLKITERFC